MRIVKEHSFRRGLNDIAVEAKDEATLDRLIDKINAAGWKEEWSMCGQDCDYGFATEYAIPHDQFEQFNQAYKKAKAELTAEINAEKTVKVETKASCVYGLIAGIKTKYTSGDARGFKTDDALYLFDGAIGSSVKFEADGVTKIGKIVRVNGLDYGSNDAVVFISVNDDVETWTNDEDMVVPVNWSVSYGKFELVPPLVEKTKEVIQSKCCGMER